MDNNIIIMGPPGAGKGTQAHLLQESLAKPLIGTGDSLRRAIADGTALGVEAAKYMNDGLLVPDQLIIDLILLRLQNSDCANGFILDGFPRTTVQAEVLETEQIKINNVVVLSIDDTIIIDRLSKRRVHVPSGRVYHLADNPPVVEGCDDVTGESLTLRPDDNPDTIRARLEVYHAQTAPLVAFYHNIADVEGLQYIQIDASQSIDAVHQAILASIIVN